MKTRFSFLVIISAFLLFGAGWADSSQSGDKKNTDQKTSLKQSASQNKINWLRYDDGLALAKKEGKKVFVEFTAKWCGWCKKMHATTFIDSEVIKIMGDNFVSVSVDGDSRDTINVDGWITNGKSLARQYRIKSYPTYWILTPEAEQIAPVVGYRDKATLASILDYLKDDQYKTVSYKDYLEAKKKK
jgi:thioredoxin-related protein